MFESLIFIHMIYNAGENSPQISGYVLTGTKMMHHATTPAAVVLDHVFFTGDTPWLDKQFSNCPKSTVTTCGDGTWDQVLELGFRL